MANLNDTEPSILEAEARSTNALRNLVIHECSQVILLIAVCCVLPRYDSRVIQRTEFSVQGKLINKSYNIDVGSY